MKLIEFFETTLHATAFISMLIVVKAPSVVTREVKARDSQLHLSVAGSSNHVSSAIDHGLSIFDSDILEVCIFNRDVPLLLTSSLRVELLHCERESSHHCDVFPAESVVMPIRIPPSQNGIRCLQDFFASGSLNNFR